MLAIYFSIIRNNVLSASSQRKFNFYHQNTLLDAFRTNSRNIIGRDPSMVIPLLANHDLTPTLCVPISFAASVSIDRVETMHACVLLFFTKQNGARREEQRGSGEITFTVTNRKNIVTLSYN